MSNRQLPPEIYRRRRWAAGVILAVFLLLLIWLVSSVIGTESDSKTTVESTKSTEVDLEAASSSKAKASSEKKKADQRALDEERTDLIEKNTCELSDLILRAETPQATFGPGDRVIFELWAKNPTTSDCVINLEEVIPSFEVYSLDNPTRVWGDTDCNLPTSNKVFEIKAGEEKGLELQGWSRTTSAPPTDNSTDTCSSDYRQLVPTGSYVLYGKIGDNASDGKTFNLVNE